MYLSGIKKTSYNNNEMEEKPPSVNQAIGLLKTIQQIKKTRSKIYILDLMAEAVISHFQREKGLSPSILPHSHC